MPTYLRLLHALNYNVPMLIKHRISQLKNLGPKSETWLNAIGVYTLEDLRDMGAIDSCKALKAHGYNINLNLAYAIEGALRDTHWTKLPDNIRQNLKTSLKEKQ
jgi:TfoX C-terminal domain